MSKYHDLKLDKTSDSHELYNRILRESITNDYDLFPFETYMKLCNPIIIQGLYNQYLKGNNLYHLMDWSKQPQELVENFLEYIKHGYTPNEYTYNVLAKIEYKCYKRKSVKLKKLAEDNTTLLRGIPNVLTPTSIGNLESCINMGLNPSDIPDYISSSMSRGNFKVACAIYQTYGERLNPEDILNSNSTYHDYSVGSCKTFMLGMHTILDMNLVSRYTLNIPPRQRFGSNTVMFKSKPNSQAEYTLGVPIPQVLAIFETFSVIDELTLTDDIYYTLVDMENSMLHTVLQVIAEEPEAINYIALGLSGEDLLNIFMELFHSIEFSDRKFVWEMCDYVYTE